MAAAVAPALALPAVAQVNLMPRAEIERRQTSALLRRWVGFLLLALLVVAVVCGGTVWLQFGAQQRLASEQARTQSLLTDLAALSDVRATLELESELTTFREQAMATDLEWAGLLSTIESALPAGVAVSGFQLAPGGVPIGEESASEVGAVGSVFLKSAVPQDIVALVRTLRPVEGVLVAEAWKITPDPEGGFTYEIRVAFDQSVYTGAYREESGE
ncbi:hypothetical protein ACFQ0P_12690 [Microbacterium insulae]|uniref:Fimbrial assembly protein (PilN) n=1 Tax=Microbacterium insulae TaxID=483014 RepID=A0ABW3AJX4_9MICO